MLSALTDVRNSSAAPSLEGNGPRRARVREALIRLRGLCRPRTAF